MDLNVVEKKVKELLSEQLGIKEDKISSNSRITDDLGADSLDVVEMLMTVEREWKVAVDDDEIGGLSTVNDVVKLIGSKL